MKLIVGSSTKAFTVVMPDGSFPAAHLCDTPIQARDLHSALRKRNGNKGEVKRIRVTVEIIDEPRD